MNEAPGTGSIGEVIDVFTACYGRQEFNAAYEYLTKAQLSLPLYHSVLLAWRIAMAARSGQREHALELVDEAIRAGYWIHEKALAQDPDFASLLSEPRFTEAMNVFARRRSSAEMEIKPDRIVIEPHGFEDVRPLLMVMHGNLGNMVSFAPYWHKAADLGYRVAVLQSTQTTWVSGFYVWDDHSKVLAELREHYSQLCQQYPVDLNQVFVAGFSSGGGLAARAALSGVFPVRGFWSIEYFGTDMDKPEIWAAWFDKPVQDLKAVLQFGDLGQGWLDGVNLFAAQLEQHRIPSRIVRTSNTCHAMPPEFDTLLPETLAYLAA